MKKKISRAVLIAAILAGAFLYAHVDKNIYLYDRSLESEDFINTGILEEGETLEQTFTMKDEAIDGINLKISSVGNVEDVTLLGTLKDAGSNEKVSEFSVAGSEIKNNKINKLKVPRVEDTKGKEYTLVLACEGSDEQNGLSFYVTQGNVGKLTVKGNDTNGVLVSRMLCHRFDVETFIVLLGFVAFVYVFMRTLYKLFK